MSAKSDHIYQDYHSLLFPIALNMLKEIEDAEDLVQETMIKWLTIEQEEIENPKGYLVKTLINKCLNFIRSRKKIETLAEIEIPHELISDHYSQLIEKGPVLSLSFSKMLEKLNPMERAVFILKEVFHYSHKEIAALLGLTEENSRQVLARAKKHLKADKARFAIDKGYHETLYQRFIDVCNGNDLQLLIDLLKEDIQVNTNIADMTIENHVHAAEYLLFVLRKISHLDFLWWIHLNNIALVHKQQLVGIIRLQWREAKVQQLEVELFPEHQYLLEIPHLTEPAEYV